MKPYKRMQIICIKWEYLINSCKQTKNYPHIQWNIKIVLRIIKHLQRNHILAFNKP